MTGDGRKRQPKGVPVGGQFDSNAHDEAGPLTGSGSGSGSGGEVPPTGGGGGSDDPYIAEARALNDELDSMWVERQRSRLVNGAQSVRGGDADRIERERDIRARLNELKERTDGRGFDPYTFSTPDPRSVDSRETLSNGAIVAKEIEADIEQGVASGALSPLFDYKIEFKESDQMTPSTLSVEMTKKGGVTQDKYLNVLRAKTERSRPEYSDRLRATVSRIQKRLDFYSLSSGSKFKVKVTTNLPHLGD